MGYELFNRMGLCVGPFTSALGYDAIQTDVAKRRRRFPSLDDFLSNGFGDVTPELLDEIKAYIALNTKCQGIAEDLLSVLKRMKFASIGI